MKTLIILKDGKEIPLSGRMTALLRAILAKQPEIDTRKSCHVECHVGVYQVAVKIPPEPTVEKIDLTPVTKRA